MKKLVRIAVAKDFGKHLFGRYPEDGDLCGENFRARLIIPALQEAEKIEIDFSGVVATPSSFFEEAFGGLVRVLTKDPDLRQSILGAPSDADPGLIAEALKRRISATADEIHLQKRVATLYAYMTRVAEII